MALVPLLYVLLPEERSVRPGTAFRLGYWWGVAFFLILLHWIPKLPKENVTVPFLMYPALGLMVAYLALYPAVWAAGVTALCRRKCPWLLAGVASGLWILLEWVRNLGVVGFPWGSLGYSQWAALPFIQFARIGGFWSVSYWIVLVNVAIFVALRATGTRRVAPAAIALALFVLPWLYGTSVIAAFRKEPPRGQPVLLIQPSTGNDKWDPKVRNEVINHLVTMTLDAVHSAPADALVMWPETATPTILLQDPANYGYVQSVVAQIKRPLLTGFPDRLLFRNVNGNSIEARYYNAAGLILPGGGMVETYYKMRLVPFSEWMPVPGLNKVNFGQSNFTPGDSLKVFSKLRDWPGAAATADSTAPGASGATNRNGHRFGVLICYESIFPSMSRALIRNGAEFLVNVTNDQWFGRSAAPYQHLTMCVFRAIENNVGIARAANTGVSCLIDPVGEIHQATNLFEPGTVQGLVRLAGAPTFYTRFGDWILLLALAGVGVGVVMRVIGATPRRSGS